MRSTVQIRSYVLRIINVFPLTGCVMAHLTVVTAQMNSTVVRYVWRFKLIDVDLLTSDQAYTKLNFKLTDFTENYIMLALKCSK